jgi:hypothetical protein
MPPDDNQPSAVMQAVGQVTKQAASIADQHLDPDWRIFHKLWSMRIAFFWACTSGLYVALPAFEAYVDARFFAVLCVGFSVAIMVGRLYHQPGLD